MKENQLVKAREEVIIATMDKEKEGSEENQEDECIMNIKCKGDCTHIMVEYQCHQCVSRFKNKTAMEKHVKESHTKFSICPFCSVSLSNSQVLGKHIEDHHPDTTLHTLQAAPAPHSSTTGANPT